MSLMRAAQCETSSGFRLTYIMPELGVPPKLLALMDEPTPATAGSSPTILVTSRCISTIRLNDVSFGE